jgi:hypothetical protein
MQALCRYHLRHALYSNGNCFEEGSDQVVSIQESAKTLLGFVLADYVVDVCCMCRYQNPA